MIDSAISNLDGPASANAEPPRRLARRPAMVVREVGRAAAAVVPVSVVTLVGETVTAERVAAAAVLAVLWVLGISIGMAFGGPSYTALGPRFASLRGVVLALVATSAIGAWFAWLHVDAWRSFLTAFAVFLADAVWEGIVLRHVVPAKRLLLVGLSRSAEDLISGVELGQGGGYEIVGVVHDGVAAAVGSVPTLGRVENLGAVIEASRPDIVVLAPGPNRPQMFGELLEAAEAGFRVVELAQFYEHAYGRVPVHDLTRAWFMSVLHLYQRPYSKIAKRSFDLCGAAVLLVLTLPLLPLLALMVKLTPGPIMFRQVRLGEHGRLFTINKFRTMRVDAERNGTAVWAREADPRVTRVGATMRRLRLDELPQLWNVVKGEMSLVGPRPERPEFLAELNAAVPFWTRRHLVKPGLTGWAQVRQGYTASAEATSDKLSYDFWYIRHRSLTVDLAICLRTLAVVLHGDGRARRRAAQPRAAVREMESF